MDRILVKIKTEKQKFSSKGKSKIILKPGRNSTKRLETFLSSFYDSKRFSSLGLMPNVC